MITKKKMPWPFIKFSQLILKGNVWDQFGEFACGYWGLKGWERRWNGQGNAHSVIGQKEFHDMYLLTEWEGWKGKHLARGQNVRTERIKWILTQSICILPYDRCVFEFLWRGENAFTAAFFSFHTHFSITWRVWPSYGTFFIGFSKEKLARSRAGHTINVNTLHYASVLSKQMHALWLVRTRKLHGDIKERSVHQNNAQELFTNYFNNESKEWSSQWIFQFK